MRAQLERLIFYLNLHWATPKVCLAQLVKKLAIEELLTEIMTIDKKPPPPIISVKQEDEDFKNDENVKDFWCDPDNPRYYYIF